MTEITHDPATWPTGDKLWDLARAIAFAEGANIAGSVPDRLNNPGDISDGAITFGYEHHSGSNVTKFPTKLDGWNILRNKLYRLAMGDSAVYHRDMTWEQFAMKWAGNWKPWVATVTHHLNVKPNATLAGYFGQKGKYATEESHT